MAYFMVDDQITFHPKAIAAGNAAMGVWTRAGAWAKAHATGGFVPVEVAHSLGKRESTRLVSVGLWLNAQHELLGDGYQFHDWEDTAGNASEEEEKRRREEQRERNRERKRAQRERERHAVTPPVTPEGSHGVRPVPPSPSPIPIPVTDKKDFQGHVTQGDARDGADDDEFIVGEFEKLGITSRYHRDRTVAAIRSVVPGVSVAGAVDVARELMLLSLAPVQHPVPYVEASCRNSPLQVVEVWRRLSPPRAVEVA